MLERLFEWAAAALETSSNQPILPYAILVLNASENDIDPELWDVEKATKNLLDSLSHTVNQNLVFAKHAKYWRDRGRTIASMKDLVSCYYSSLKVSGDLKLIGNARCNVWATDESARSYAYRSAAGQIWFATRPRSCTMQLRKGAKPLGSAK